MKNDLMLQCPRFDFCNVNHCPLDIERDIHSSDTTDPSRKCGLSQNKRKMIGEKLPMRGMSVQEYHLDKVNRKLKGEK